MPYPWPSFGSFFFQASETAIFGTDSGWNYSPSYGRSRALGSNIDSITTFSLGSQERRFELYLSPSRLATFKALQNTTGLFTFWPDSKLNVPDSRQTFLAEVEQQEEVAVLCSDGTTQRRIRVSVLLVEQ